MDVVHVQLNARRAIALAAAALLLAGCASSTPHHPAAPRSPSSSTSLPTSPAITPSTSTTASGLAHFDAIDLSFVGDDDGWALGSADCISPSGQQCIAIARTTDGGRTWHSTSTPPGSGLAMLPCTDLCVQHIRFATADIGYAFGSSVFFTTTNGGQTWTRESGGADALESLNGNVIRLVSDHGGCPGPCNLRVERAPIGSEEWKSGTLDRQAIDAAVVTLVRTGSRAFVETTSGPAGSLYRVMLYVSSDNGLSWSKRTDPCETVGAAAAGVPLASNSLAAAGGAVSIVCAGGGANQTKQVVITSADAGATYRSSKVLHLDCCGPGELGAASATVLVAVSTHLWRSIDGGESWLAVPGVKTGNSTVFVGFESPIVGRLVTESDFSPTKNTTIWNTTIWTTRDAGATWTSYAFS